ncbi:hypothetical protein TSOC_002948 [Tetrabaena socialis]|uniref:Arrestin-like N-terminal domain-containing protein n=1 Tax=Tetrabaena socialis TaxID=47790 RepID=A0A2J8ACU8_9CHLO|nr:hypothetical protein TSOC_002948 [Tetrabaena socialis]|eukprot:PNH10340.1 hypothetical protein TSOC_002948 [Tetrabaena socialis]
MRTGGPTHAPGDVVSGSVLLNAAKAAEYTHLVLTVAVQERTHWEQRTKSSYTNSYGGRRVIYMATMKLREWRSGGTCPPGHYQFPFSFELPPDTPPSLHARAKNPGLAPYL